jgi:hypothetical protein
VILYVSEAARERSIELIGASEDGSLSLRAGDDPATETPVD